MRERIERRYPGHGVLAEEFGDRTAKQETRWIIDPIDATHSYLRGIPVFAILIALERAGVMELGIMSAPAMRERWHAARGGGAWSGKRRLHVSRVSQLGDAQIFYASRSAFKAVAKERAFDRVVDGAWRDRGFGDFWGYAVVAPHIPHRSTTSSVTVSSSSSGLMNRTLPSTETLLPGTVNRTHGSFRQRATRTANA